MTEPGLSLERFERMVRRDSLLRAVWRLCVHLSPRAFRTGLKIVWLSVKFRWGEVRILPDQPRGVVFYFFGGPKSEDGGWQRQGGLFVNEAGVITRYCRDRELSECEFQDVESTMESLASAVRTIHEFLYPKKEC